MSPSEPPVSIYGTLPRSVGKMVAAPLGNSPALSSHYATFRKEKLGPRTSLKLMAMMKEGARREEDTRSIISGFTEGSGSRGEERLRSQAEQESQRRQVFSHLKLFMLWDASL